MALLLRLDPNRTSNDIAYMADIAMVASQVDGIDGDGLLAALRVEEGRRRAAGALDGPLPNGLRLDPEQERDWRQRWTKATRGAPITFDEALATAERFVGPALAHAVGGTRWSAVDQTWHST